MYVTEDNALTCIMHVCTYAIKYVVQLCEKGFFQNLAIKGCVVRMNSPHLRMNQKFKEGNIRSRLIVSPQTHQPAQPRNALVNPPTHKKAGFYLGMCHTAKM
jgi:hypothetical protein